MASIAPAATTALPAAAPAPPGAATTGSPLTSATSTLAQLQGIASSLGISTGGTNAATATTFAASPAPTLEVVGGGLVEAAGSVARNAVESLAQFAQKRMDKAKLDVQNLASNSGTAVNVAELQRLNQEMEMGTQLMQLAQKLQDNQNKAIETWLR